MVIILVMIFECPFRKNIDLIPFFNSFQVRLFMMIHGNIPSFNIFYPKHYLFDLSWIFWTTHLNIFMIIKLWIGNYMKLLFKMKLKRTIWTGLRIFKFRRVGSTLIFCYFLEILSLCIIPQMSLSCFDWIWKLIYLN